MKLNDWQLRIIRKHNMIRRKDRYKADVDSYLCWYSKELKDLNLLVQWCKGLPRTEKQIEEIEAIIWYLAHLKSR